MARPLPSSFTISSDVFLIRPMMRSDASAKLESWIEDEDAASMLNTERRNWTLGQQIEYFGRHEGDPERHILGIFPRQSKEPIGLFIVKTKVMQGVFTISHLIGDPAWRGGDTTFRASELVYDYLFNVLGYAKAKANVRPENKPMLWLMYNYVWRREARLLKHLRIAITKERSDLLTFGMLADEWRAFHENARGKAQSSGQVTSGTGH